LGYLFINSDVCTLVIGKAKAPENRTDWNSGEYLLRVATQSWPENEALLRSAMNSGHRIRDTNPFRNTGFLKDEHALLRSEGWLPQRVGNLWYWIKNT
jgi:hypothetical protein